MNVTMKIDPDNALIGFSKRSGWAQGWGVVKGPPEDREFAGIFVNRDEAEGAALKAGAGFEVRWGSFDPDNNDYVTGDT